MYNKTIPTFGQEEDQAFGNIVNKLPFFNAST